MSPPDPPTPKPRSRRHTPKEARHAILLSVQELLWTLPLNELTVARIMQGTPMSRPAFYQYYDSIPDAIRLLFADVERVMHELANPWLAGTGEPVAALEVSLRGVIEVCQRFGAVIRAVSEASALDSGLEQVWETFMLGWDDAVASRIEAQQADGSVAEFDARRMAFALNRMDTALLIAEFGRRPQGDPELVLRAQHRIWVSVLYGRERLRP